MSSQSTKSQATQAPQTFTRRLVELQAVEGVTDRSGNKLMPFGQLR
jgi:hypothetical protein